MPKVIQAAEFFVIGGPVQPDRLCYVERAADLELENAIRERRFCCVLAPPASGKSSLMSRVARNLRRVGHLAAIVDLTQVGARGASGDADRRPRRFVAHSAARSAGGARTATRRRADGLRFRDLCAHCTYQWIFVTHTI
jgi:hypothetical protein